MLNPPLDARHADLEREQPLTGAEMVAHTISSSAAALEQYAVLIAPLRALGRRLGYAIAVHGSLARDIDLIAIPWTQDAEEDEVLVVAIANLVRAFNGFATVHGGAHDEKPHGRRSWVISLPGGTYIDLCVMPRRETCEE